MGESIGVRLCLCTVGLLLVGGIVSCGSGSESQTPSGDGRVSVETTPTNPLTFDPSTKPSAAQTYYVDGKASGASDSNDGRSLTCEGARRGPWRTIGHAAAAMKAGETTYVRGGTYYESGITFANSGEPGAPISLRNYKEETVILDGSRATKDLPGVAFVKGRDHYSLRGLTIRNMRWSGINSDLETADPYQDISVTQCELYRNKWSGIELAAVDGFSISGVKAHDNAFYGLNISASKNGNLSAENGIVENSSFYNHTDKEGHGLAVNQGHNIVIRNCVAYHNRIHGFDVSDWPKGGAVSHHITVEGNSSYDNGHAGFSVNSGSNHIVYRLNAAWHNGASWAGEGASSGFLCYESGWHLEWDNNVSLENSDGGFWVDSPSKGDLGDELLVYHNNVAWENGRSGKDERPALVVIGRQWKIIATHNDFGGAPGQNALVVGIHLVGEKGEIYSSDEINKGRLQDGNVSVDPEFVDPDGADWHLRSGSPLIDAGVDVGLPFSGSSPDMGVFETGQ